MIILCILYPPTAVIVVYPARVFYDSGPKKKYSS